MVEPPPPDDDAQASLLPADLRASLPPLYATENEADPIARVKLFTPWSSWTWFVTEFDGEDTCFGLVVGHETELGYFSLSEIEGLRGPGGLHVERDGHFQATRLSALRKENPSPPAPS